LIEDKELLPGKCHHIKDKEVTLALRFPISLINYGPSMDEKGSRFYKQLFKEAYIQNERQSKIFDWGFSL